MSNVSFKDSLLKQFSHSCRTKMARSLLVESHVHDGLCAHVCPIHHTGRFVLKL